MSDEVKKRVQLATEKFMKKQLPSKKRTQKNQKPEQDAVNEILQYCRSLGWSLNVVESKATFSQKTQRYISQSTVSGFPDIVGNTEKGTAVYIEVKAKGRRATIRPQQYHFLVGKIKTNCFAVCADSKEYLQELIKKYSQATNKQDLLLLELPTPALIKHESIDPFF